MRRWPVPIFLGLLLGFQLACGGGGSNGTANLGGGTQPAAGFSYTGSLARGRSSFSAVLLGNGKVLVAGGTGAVAAELYDPTTGSFATTGPMAAPDREAPTVTKLADGKVLITGGYGFPVLTSAERYDPATGIFTTMGAMSSGRYGHSATLLATGQVLVAGYTTSSELYDATTGRFSATGPLSVTRSYHTATLLPNGKVLIAGGQLASGSATTGAELYNPATGTFSATGSLRTPRRAHQATLLADGTVLIAGGSQDNSGANVLASAEIYDPTAGTFAPTGSMHSARENHRAALLASGSVLITGGYSGGGSSGYLASAEIYDPALRTFTATATAMNKAREAHCSIVLSNGNVLIAGGSDYSSAIASAELYK